MPGKRLLQQLAREHGTPLFVVDHKEVICHVSILAEFAYDSLHRVPAGGLWSFHGDRRREARAALRRAAAGRRVIAG